MKLQLQQTQKNKKIGPLMGPIFYYPIKGYKKLPHKCTAVFLDLNWCWKALSDCSSYRKGSKNGKSSEIK